MCVCMKWGRWEVVFYKSIFPPTPIDRGGDIEYICVDVMSYDVVGVVKEFEVLWVSVLKEVTGKLFFIRVISR